MPKTKLNTDQTDNGDFTIHTNLANEINIVAEKVAPVGDDIFLIEDSESSNEKKKVKIVNLPSSGDMLQSTYDPAGVSEQLVGLVASQSLTNKSVNGVTLTTGGVATNFLNETGVYSAAGGGGGGGVSEIFNAYKTSLINPLPTTPVLIVHDTETIDTGNNYNNATGLYTAPSAGEYQFHVFINGQNLTDGDELRCLMYVNGTTLVGFFNMASSKSGGNLEYVDGTIILDLAINDTVEVRVGNATASRGNTITASYDNYFEGYKLA